MGMMLEGAGFKVFDLGTDVSPQKFVEAVKQQQPQLVGCSALITTTMLRKKDDIEALKAAGVRERVKVIVGGAPVTEEYARLIGADRYAPDASSAATRAKQAVLQTAASRGQL